jgi:23S rRNA (guanosine2251-2'-O)-methyltransferase
VDGIILTINNSASITDTVEKTSAGAVSHLKICKEKNLNNSIKKLKEEGFWIVGSTLDNAKDYTAVDYKIPVALVVGNEEKGIRKLVAENCDFLTKIPMKGKIQSMNVSVATGVLLFEILRQRNSE